MITFRLTRAGFRKMLEAEGRGVLKTTHVVAMRKGEQFKIADHSRPESPPIKAVLHSVEIESRPGDSNVAWYTFDWA